MQLVINTKGALLRRRGERFEIRSGERTHEFAARKIQSIVIATGVRLTSDAIQLAAESNVDIVFLNSAGDPTSRVWQTRMGSTATIRRRQLQASLNQEGQSIAISWIETKLQNQLLFLRDLAERREKAATTIAESIDQISSSQEKLAQLRTKEGSPDDMTEARLAETRGTVMGLEGSAGRSFFQTISRLLPEEYRFENRSRRPAQDSFNATLNYAYGVLYSQVERALILAGLDPFIGFLHADHYNKPSLTFDLIEPFRIIAERTTVLLFTGRRVKADYFRAVPGGIELSPDGRAPLIEALNQRLDKVMRYPNQCGSGNPRKSTTPDPPTIDRPLTPGNSKKTSQSKQRNIKTRQAIRYEAHALANRLLGRHDIPKLIETSELLGE